MNKAQVKRRDFLKSAGSLLLGAILIPLGRFAGFVKGEKERPNVSRHEARYYAPTDDWAG